MKCQAPQGHLSPPMGGGRARAAARISLPLISRGAKEVAQIKAFLWLFFWNAFWTAPPAPVWAPQPLTRDALIAECVLPVHLPDNPVMAGMRSQKQGAASLLPWEAPLLQSHLKPRYRFTRLHSPWLLQEVVWGPAPPAILTKFQNELRNV